jgi:integrase
MLLRTRLKKALALAGIERWVPNGCRHSFATYHYALHQSADMTAAQLGHSNTELLFEHYREVVTPQDAAAFWQIMPESP